MAKTKISEFSSTPANNTDIDSINIAEGCAPSGINNAIRELMAQLKDFQTGAAGDSFNGPVGTTTAAAGAFTTLSASGAFTYGGVTLSNAVTGTGNMVLSNSPTLVTPALGTPSALVGTNITGTAAGLSIGGNAATATTSTNVSGGTASVTTLSASGAVTLSGGTANGVAYLNGSKVLTTGSALTFDGTTLANSTSGTPLSLNRTGAGTAVLELKQSGVVGSYLGTSGSNDMIFFSSAAAELMRLTSTGLGIGTSSPGSKLSIAVSTTAANADIELSNSAGVKNYVFTGGSTNATTRWRNNLMLYTGGAQDILFETNATERMRLDSSGNLGLGVTPSAWGGDYKSIDITASASFTGSGGSSAFVANNAYNDGSTWRYKTSTANIGTQLFGLNPNGTGGYAFFTAPSGTAGNAISFTQAMTLNASGSLSIGTTAADNKVTVYDTNYPFVQFCNSSTGIGGNVGFRVGYEASVGAYIDNLQNSPMIFRTNAAERARIDTSGNLLVGTTSTSAYLDGKINAVASGVAPAICAKLDPANTNPAQFVYSAWAPFNSGDNIFMSFETEVSATIRGSISYNRGAGVVAYNTTSDYRAKDIIGPLTDSGAVIDSTPVYMGKMKGATQERPMFIAHETPAYAHTGEKDAVDADGNPVYQQMDASALVPVMWAEIQSLRQRLAAAGI